MDRTTERKREGRTEAQKDVMEVISDRRPTTPLSCRPKKVEIDDAKGKGDKIKSQKAGQQGSRQNLQLELCL